jgi:tRNA nucleotidyltransferase (CCA-adding enzyme)
MSQPTTVTVPQPIAPLLTRVGAAADRHGVPAYAVGGCVRDWLLGVDRSPDLDVAVEGDGIAFARSLAQELGVGLLAHEQFGTATLMLPVEHAADREPTLRLDIATCRKESYAVPAAYPKVEPGRLEDDLYRRDFTINAMAMAIGAARFGALIDPYGGLQDLRAKRLRILHPNSFIDDPSRILRAARFLPRFGCALEEKTESALRQAIADGLLTRLNRGRLRRELEHMVHERDPLACLGYLGRWLTGPGSAP